MDLSQLKRLVLNFEKALARNLDQRVKYADDPVKQVFACLLGLG